MRELPAQRWSKTSFKRNRRRAKSRELRQGRPAPLRYQRIVAECGDGKTLDCVVLGVQQDRIRVHTHTRKRDGVWYLRLCDEGKTWVRGHAGEVPDAFRAQVALLGVGGTATDVHGSGTWTWCAAPGSTP